MSRQQSRYALPKDTDFRAALEASDDGYSDDDRSSYSGSSRSSGSTRSSAHSSSTASARSLDRYADRASSGKKGQGNNSNSRQMKKNQQRRRREEMQRHGNNADRAGGRKPDQHAGDPPTDGAQQSAAVRKAAATTTTGGRGGGKQKGAPPGVHRDTRYDVPSHKKRRKRPNKRKEKHPASAAGIKGGGAASGAAAAAASAVPDKYAATDVDYLDDDPDGQIEITLSPSDSYGVEVHESRNVSNRGYAFAKPLDKRYMGKNDDTQKEDGSSREVDRKISEKMISITGDKTASMSSQSSVQIAKFALTNFPALPPKPLPSALTENAGMHRMQLRTPADGMPGSGKKMSLIDAKDLLLSMPVCDELSAVHKEAYFMQQEIRAIKNDRLVREIDCVKMYNRRLGRKPLVLEESSEEDCGGHEATSEIFQDEEWDADLLLASYAEGGSSKGRDYQKGKWRGRRNADYSSRDKNPGRFGNSPITKQQRRKLERKRGICLTIHISDERIQDAFKTEFANIANAIEESDAGGRSTILSSSDERVRDITDRYSTMAVSPGSSPTKKAGKMSNATLTSTASKLITVIGCRALRSMNFLSITQAEIQSGYDAEQRDVGFWYISDDNSASCVGMPPPKFAERLSRERNLSSGAAYPVSNVHYMASGPLGSYFVRFASGETWWGLGGTCPSQHEQFAQIMKKIEVRRIAFGPPCSEFIKGGSTVTVVPWVAIGTDGTVAWSSSLPSSFERLFSDRPRDLAAPVEVSLGAGGSYFVKFADGNFKCVVSSPLANVCRQIEAKGARITNMVLHAESHAYIIRHSKFRNA